MDLFVFYKKHLAQLYKTTIEQGLDLLEPLPWHIAPFCDEVAPFHANNQLV